MIHKGYRNSHGLIQACTLSFKFSLDEMGVLDLYDGFVFPITRVQPSFLSQMNLTP